MKKSLGISVPLFVSFSLNPIQIQPYGIDVVYITHARWRLVPLSAMCSASGIGMLVIFWWIRPPPDWSTLISGIPLNKYVLSRKLSISTYIRTYLALPRLCLSTSRHAHLPTYPTYQGKVLPQPETVPFRLTRDLVDAMGATGTEGVFRQCCNTTMAVLRQHAPSLLTILEVCVHDPLHSWVRAAVPFVAAAGAGGGATVAEEAEGGGGGGEDEASGGRARRRKIRKVVGGAAAAAAAANTTSTLTVAKPTGDAERAILRIRQKLKGYEDPTGDAMSVEGHVKYLISEATDPDNLARIYHGW